MAGKQFIDNMSSHKTKLITLLFYFRSNPATVPLANAFGWLPMRPIGAINRICRRWGKRHTTVMMFDGGVVSLQVYIDYFFH